VCWLRAREDVGLQIVSFARSHLDLDVPQDRELAEQVAWCWQHWQEKPTLIVLDDVQQFADVQAVLPPPRSHFKVLMTSRSRFAEDPVKVLMLEQLQPLSAFRLLYEIVDGSTRLEKEQLAAEELCEWLGYLPLGVKLVATFLKVEPDLSVSAMLAQLKTETLKHDGLTAIETVFELSWEKLATPERQLTALLSLFAAAPIPWVLVSDVAQGCRIVPSKQGWMQRVLSLGRRPAEPVQWCTLLEPRQLERSRRLLVKLSLLARVDEEQYQLHPLLREFFAGKRILRGTERSQLAEDEAMKRSFCAAMVSIGQQIPQTVTLDIIEQFSSAIPHLKEAATTLTPWLTDEDLIWTPTSIARFYAGQSAFGEAEEWTQKCLAIATERLGADHPAVATSLNNLALLYESQGRYGEAEPLYVRSHEIRQRQLGEDHPDVASSLNNLAGLYASQGRYGEAEPLYGQALEISDRTLGVAHPTSMTIRQNYATCLKSMVSAFKAASSPPEGSP
jgi:Tetratricopeptide repeat/NB-ARC domain